MSITVSIREAIEICVKNGIKGAENQLRSFDKSGRLASKDQINALQLNLECIYKNVQINGSGKRGTVLLSELLDELGERYDGRKHNEYKHTDEELILDEHVFNFLLRQESEQALPYKTWARHVGFFPLDLLKDKHTLKRMKKAVDELHHETIQYTSHAQKMIINTFIDTISSRGESVVEMAFNRLEKSGRIVVENRYFIKTLSDRYKEIPIEMYERLVREENIILEEEGMERSDYVRMKIMVNHRNKLYSKVHKKINAHMEDNYNIDYYYIAKLPIVLDRENQSPVEVDGMAAYYSRLFKLTESRSKSYENSREIWQYWYLVNTYTLLKLFGIDVPEDRYNEELERLEMDHFGSFVIDSKEKIKREVEGGLPDDF